MNKKWWLAVFASFQLVGCILPLFANVHTNVAPLLAGLFLTLPGSAILSAFPPNDVWSSWAYYTLMVVINFGAWAMLTIVVSLIQRRVEPHSG